MGLEKAKDEYIFWKLHEKGKRKNEKKKEKNNKSEGDSKELQKPKAAQNIKQKLDTLCKEKKSSNRQNIAQRRITAQNTIDRQPHSLYAGIA